MEYSDCTNHTEWFCNICGASLQKYVDDNNRLRVKECPSCKDRTNEPKKPVFIHNTFKEDMTKQWQKKQAKRGKKF